MAPALEIAERIGDLGICVLTTTYLAQAHYYRGDYELAVAVATGSLALRSADGVYARHHPYTTVAG